MRRLLQKKWLWITALFAVINVIGLVAIYRAIRTPGPALSVHISPSAGELSITDRPRVEFSEPMIPRTAIGQPVAPDMIQLTPAEDGEFVWLSRDSCSWKSGKSLRPATHYRLSIAPEMRSQTGRHIGPAAECAWETPRPIAERISQTDLDSQGRLTIRLKFNMAVTTQALQKNVTVTTAAGTQLAYTARNADAARRVHLIKTAPLPEIGPVQVVVTKGLKGADGELVSQKDIREKIEVDGELHIHSLDSDSADNGESLFISFYSNCRIDLSRVTDFIRLQPPVKVTASKRWGGIRLDGDFQPDTSYMLTFLRGLPAANGRKLKAPLTRRLRTPNFPAKLQFGCEGIYMAAGVERPILPLRTMNVDRVDLTVQRVFENNILLCLRDQENGVPQDMGPTAITTKLETTNPKNLPRDTNVDLMKVLGRRPLGVYFIKGSNAENKWQRDVKLVMITNLGITVHRTNKSVLVWVNALDSAAPVANAMVTVHSKANQRLGQGVTDANGIVRFDDMPTDKDDMPFAVTAKCGDDLAFLPLDRGAMRLQDLKLSGRPFLRQGYEAFVFSDRGVYRPGEQAYLQSFVRTMGMELPDTVPVVFKVTRPDGRLFHESSVQLSTSGSAGIRLALPRHAQTGRYQVSVMLPKAKGPLGQSSFQVEEFMPDRLKVRIEAMKGVRGRPGKELAVSVSGEHYFGSPAVGRRAELRGQFVPSAFSSREFPDYSFGSATALPDTFKRDLGDAKLDTDGKATFRIEIPKTLPKTNSMQLVLTATVKEVGGRAVTAAMTIPVDVSPVHIGLRKMGSDWCRVGRQDQFRLVLLQPSGQLNPVAAKLQVQCFLVSWNTVVREDESGRWRYVSERQELLRHTTEADVLDGKGSFRWTPKGTGTYLIRVRGPQSQAITEMEVICGGNGYVHWDMRKADRLQLTTDKPTYHPGDMAKVRVQSPFTGRVLLTLESDRVLSARVLEMTGNTMDVEFPVESTWAPNIYCTATVIRTPKRAALVGIQRAFGAVPLRLDYSSKRLQVAVSAPKVARPDVPFNVKVKVLDHSGLPARAEIFLAAVDEGVLSLTAHRTPEPWNWFSQPRGLATSVNDVYGLVMPDYGQHLIGRDSVAGGGGNRAGNPLARLLNPIAAKRVRVVSLVRANVQTDAAGIATVALTVPEFEGELRIMAIAAGAAGVGSAEESIKVRSPLMIRPTLPRFLAPHDEVSVPVAVFNRTGRDGRVELEIGGINIGLPEQCKAQLTVADGHEAKTVFLLRSPVEPGKATIILTAKLGSESITRRIELPVRPPESLRYISGSGAIAAGKTKTLDIAGTFVKGTGKYSVTFNSRPDLKLTDSLKYLIRYPYGCLEQTTSKTFPLLCMAPLAKQNLPKDGHAADIDYYVSAGINRVLSMQLTSGGFTLWPSGASPYPWGSVYATHMLVEANKAGHPVPAASLASALTYLDEVLRQSETRRETKAYACYVLAIAGRPNRSWTMRLYEERKSLPTYSQFQIARALWQLRERKTAASLVALTQLPLVDQKPELSGILNSPVRRDAILLSTFVDVNPHSPLVHDLARRLSRALEPGRYYSTQSNSFALVALGRYLNTQDLERAKYVVRVEQDGKLLRKFTEHDAVQLDLAKPGPLTVKVEGEGQVYFHWSGEGVSFANSPEEDSGLKVRRRLLARDGSPLDPAGLTQGELVVVELSLYADRDLKNIAVNDLLPAAFEIENPNLQTREAMPWLRRESLRPQRVERRDDRFLVFTDLRCNRWQRYRYAARIVSRGKFVLPSVHAFCMYDQSISSRHGRGMVEVVK